jgi:hypothetical protein
MVVAVVVVNLNFIFVINTRPPYRGNSPLNPQFYFCYRISFFLNFDLGDWVLGQFEGLEKKTTKF